MATRASDPLVGFHFKLDLQDQITGYFTEVSGLGSETETIEHKVVTPDGQDVVQKLPGRLKWGDITLKRGITDMLDFWNWRKLVEDGKVGEARKNGSVMMFNQALELIAQWDFVNAWPSKVSGPQLSSDSNAYGIEEITIVHEGIERVK